MQATSQKNICIIASSLGGGGAERVAAQQSNLLKSIGFNVYIVTILNSVTYPVCGELLNLGLEIDKKDSIKAKITRHFRIRQFLIKNKIDVIIDHRIRSSALNELLYAYFTYFGKAVLYYVHSYKIENYMPKNNLVFRTVFKKGRKIMTVSKAIEERVKSTFDLDNIQTIYNPIEQYTSSSAVNTEVPVAYEYVLFYGRLVDEVKNIKLLINSYHKSILPKRDIKLLIVGDGKDKDMLVGLVEQLNLSEKVLFKPFIANPFAIVEKAKYTLLTSKYEGFPMTILESLACGTPVVTVNCKSGPNEIIRNEFNGLLVANNNIEALVEAMNLFILKPELYHKCKSNTKNSISQFTMEVIAIQWNNLLKEIDDKH